MPAARELQRGKSAPRGNVVAKCGSSVVARTSKLQVALIRKSSYSLENLYETLHEEGASGKRGRPCFHTGSVVTTTVDLIHDRVHFHVDSTGIERTAKLPPSLKWHFFVSLYNRDASFTLLEMAKVDDSLL